MAQDRFCALRVLADINDDAFVAQMKQASRDTGVNIRTLNPVFNWSSVDEAERQAQVRNWKRLLELADQLDVREITSEFSGDRNRARECEAQCPRGRQAARSTRS